MRTVIIGGGAAGLAAAVTAADRGDHVTLVERLDRVGKKLLATGNGRCNLMNTGPLRYPGGGDFAHAVLKRCGAAEQTAFWHSLGLQLREEAEGRVYPASGQAATVLDTLRLACALRGVTVRCGAPVTALRRKGNVWQVTAGNETLTADRVIMTGGGMAQPKLGSDGSCYALLTGLGHRLHTPAPALTQIETDTAPIAGLNGLRVRAALTVGGHSERGEVLFTNSGVSGVCVMQCARWAEPGAKLALCLLPAMGLTEAEQLRAELARRAADWGQQPMEALFTGLCGRMLGMALMKAAGIRASGRIIASLSAVELNRLAEISAAFPLTIRGVRGFDSAQVTRGGIDPADFDPATLASRIVPSLHAAGEILDVDGDCGGFNLMFAFGSGILAGQAQL